MQSVKSVAIVGGGSAGWLTALVLNTYCPFLKISLVRPRDNTPIGVGESSQADLMRLLNNAHIDVGKFFKATDSTMKCGILYRDWNAVGEDYWHPFSKLAMTGSYTPAHFYQQNILKNPSQFSYSQYYTAVHSSHDTCVNKNRVAPEAAAAFHLDARKITMTLETLLVNVEVIETSGNVESSVGEQGISALVADGRTIKADLYIDCTGFARALLGKVATPKAIPYQANVNRAAVAQLPFVDREKETTPFTRAHAHDQGWTWSIPLQTRIGSGYVYHSDFCSEDQAEQNFRNYWGPERMHDINVRHISFDSVCLRNPWEKNVVAIGLSAGFVEPLEATGLNWIITSAEILSQSLSVRYFDEDTSIKYNANMLGYIHDVLDFIDVHYLLSARRDSEFWKFNATREMPERLKLRLALYAEAMPNDANRLKTSPWAFNEISWLDILNGYHFRYSPLQINPAQENMAQQALVRIGGDRGMGISPLTCQPDRFGECRIQRASA